ncbi:hypothetical protein CCACVL1_06082 [Corchorus capsularis]|uniref:Uncharacterized protein n=1 Tax=Corchorus capsularis TaxID=210143 RepID=A0A1R3JHM9_COCAP|nr:hypothetical protein CCACVL1_06082 [Corchorus capsularis]
MDGKVAQGAKCMKEGPTNFIRC